MVTLTRSALRGARPLPAGEGLLSSLVELARFPDAMEAAMAVGLLGSHGIEAHVFDGGMNIADGSGLLIPTRVMVEEHRFARARAILDTVAP